MNINEKLILTDCDGCLLDWEYSISRWLDQHGYERKLHGVYHLEEAYDLTKERTRQLVREFNESARVAFLPPLRDSIKYVRKLHEEHGYVFTCITSMSKDPYAKELRRQNLNKMFGETVFEDIICLDIGEDKDETLLPYKNTYCYWIEDKGKNACAGYNLGLLPILIAHDHNLNYWEQNGKNKYSRVQNWKEVYNLITE